MNESSLFARRYRIKSIRLPNRDYGKPGWYFLTICTKFRTPWFGKIHDGHMQLSEIGKIVEQCWHQIPHHFPHVSLDEFVVMPDHVHGILAIFPSGNGVTMPTGVVETQNFASLHPCACHNPRQQPILRNRYHVHNRDHWVPSSINANARVRITSNAPATPISHGNRDTTND